MRKLVLFTVPFAAAVFVFVYFLSLLTGLLCAGIALLGLIVILAGKGKQRKRLAIALSGLCFGFLFCALYSQLVVDPALELDGAEEELTAELCEYPEDTRFGCRSVAEITVNGHRVRCLFYLDEDCLALSPGDRVTLTAELRRSDLDRQGETQLYYQAKGIRLLGHARSDAVIEKTAAVPLRDYPAAFSKALNEKLAEALPEDAVGLVQALLTGQRSNLSAAQLSDFRMAGVSHMIAISGMHVSILLAIIALLTQRTRGLTALLGIPLVLFFVLATGASPSVIRAAVMQIFFLLAPLLWRENDAPTSLCAALLLLLLQNPYAIANLGFQLSFGSMAGILWASGPIYRKLAGQKRIAAWFTPRYEGPRLQRVLLALRRRLVFLVLGSVSVTLGALAVTVPILALTTGTFSAYTVLSNVVILWAVSLCFAGGLLTALLGWIWLPLGSAVGWLVAWPVRYILLLAQGIARLPFALLTTDSPYLVIWLVLSYALVLCGILSHKALLPTLGILGSLVLAAGLTRLDLQPQEFRITALDVGQGQCICLRTPEFSALYDCGGSEGDAAGQHAAEYLLTAGVSRLDALILSHYDTDHVGGVEMLLYRVDVDRIYLPEPIGESTEHQRLCALAEARQIPLVYVTEQTALALANGEIRLIPPAFAQEDNDNSLSLLFSCGEYDMLVTGDLDELGERLLLHEAALPPVELYVAGHHGSRHSSSEALLAAIRPQTVLISVGYNTYGHPAQETLDRLAAVGAQVLRTDECGDISIGR